MRTHSATHSGPALFVHHDQLPHQAGRVPRTTSTPVHEQSSTSSGSHPRVVDAVLHPPLPPPLPPVVAAAVEQPPVPTTSTQAQAGVPVDLQAIPQKDLIKHLANLLSQIAAANDALPQPDLPQRAVAVLNADHPPAWNGLTTAARGAFTNPTAALAFHARNIPTFPLEAYLLRILKYCPIPNEVFLSLLVYFDRMTRLARETTGAVFAIDSYNVHRLVIAGVTVASKFLSDVFYTNTRYAKVGGLPRVEELNQLELHFLLLNNFNLVITEPEMQKYAGDLMAFANASILPTLLANPASYEPPPPQLQQPLEQHHTLWSTPHTNGVEHDQSDATASDAGDYTTDDEPTIRAAHSSASSETQSIFTVTSEDTDADRDFTEDDDDDDPIRAGLYTQGQ